MNENIPTTIGTAGEDGRLHLEWDWYAGGIPANVEFGRDVYIDTSYGFAACFSELKPGVVMGDATGAYDRASFVVGPAAACMWVSTRSLTAHISFAITRS